MATRTVTLVVGLWHSPCSPSCLCSASTCHQIFRWATFFLSQLLPNQERGRETGACQIVSTSPFLHHNTIKYLKCQIVWMPLEHKNTADFYGCDVFWWLRWAKTVHSWYFILTHDIRECRRGRKKLLQTWELRNQIKQRQKQLWGCVKCHDVSKNRNRGNWTRVSCFRYLPPWECELLFFCLKLDKRRTKVGQKEERKLVLTQEKLLFRLWRATSTRCSNAK